MRIVAPETIKALAMPESVVASVRAALIAHAAGEIISPPPGHLAFEGPPGDCHVKFGRARGAPIFVIKVATGFYDNPKRGLSSSNGLMLVMSADSGAPLALLEDQGWLTDARTAAAGVLAVEAGGGRRGDILGVLGTGLQARLQARWIAAAHDFGKIAVWGRSLAAAERMAQDLRIEGLDARACTTAAAVVACASTIVTCTPSRIPLLQDSEVGREHLIVAMGADAPGKRELDPAIIARADVIICDDVGCCLDHGEIQGLSPDPARLAVLGDLLRSTAPSRPDQLTVVDLTGLAAQDIAVATDIYRRIAE